MKSTDTATDAKIKANLMTTDSTDSTDGQISNICFEFAEITDNTDGYGQSKIKVLSVREAPCLLSLTLLRTVRTPFPYIRLWGKGNIGGIYSPTILYGKNPVRSVRTVRILLRSLLRLSIEILSRHVTSRNVTYFKRMHGGAA